MSESRDRTCTTNEMCRRYITCQFFYEISVLFCLVPMCSTAGPLDYDKLFAGMSGADQFKMQMQMMERDKEKEGISL